MCERAVVLWGSKLSNKPCFALKLWYREERPFGIHDKLLRPFSWLRYLWHFVTFVEIRTFTKFIKPTQYSCSCKTCKLLSLFEESVGTGLTSSRSHVERNKSWLILVHVGRAVARKKLQPRRTHGPLYEISRMKSSNIISLIKKIKIDSIW